MWLRVSAIFIIILQVSIVIKCEGLTSESACRISDAYTLDCSSSELSSVPDLSDLNVQTLKTPVTFRLSNNSIRNITIDNFFFVGYWTFDVGELFLDHNNISDIDENTLNLFRSLTVLDLSWNSIRRLPEKIFADDIPPLTRLSLAGNWGFLLDVNIPPTLQSVNLSSCGMTHMNTTVFRRLVNLHTLDISNNSLTTLDWSQIPKTTNLIWENNQWSCSARVAFSLHFDKISPNCSTEETTTPADTNTEESSTSDSSNVVPLNSTSTTPAPPSREQKNDLPEWVVYTAVAGLLTFYLLLGGVATLRARTLSRELSKASNWWLEPLHLPE